MDMQLKGKNILVTASSRGIGKAIAEQLAKEGANLILCSRSEEQLLELASSLQTQYGIEAVGRKVDLSSRTSIDELIAWLHTSCPTLDGLVCNTGGPPKGNLMTLDEQDWADAFQLQLMSIVRLIKGCLPLLAVNGGNILTIASSSVKQPIPGLLLSNTFRTAVAGFMKSIASECAEQRVLVNTLCPGRIATDRIAELDHSLAAETSQSIEVIQAQFERAIPLGRYGQPQELAAFAAFLLSPLNSYMTGSAFLFDGGMVQAL
ncbi:SDR family oxidoreductase [Marinicrinis sediminis]|uniref:SDR family oxidoreductase n=1 Tax=Marinicrinis sediminis TaxID=1652465 RepID=A0ABW5REE3_9BACL